MLPARTAVLNYLYIKEKGASVTEIMEALKPEYGHEKQFNKDLYLEHVMSLEASGLLELIDYTLDEQGELLLTYRINDDGKATVEKYVPEKYRK